MRRSHPQDLLTHYKVDPPTGCWIWQGAIATHGYGRIDRRGFPHRAHRFFYMQHVGPIPDGLVIDHVCRNKACVNPSHLEAVTMTENTLRGFGITAQLHRREECPRGHSDWKVYPFDGRERRFCMTCKKNRDANRRKLAKERNHV